MQLVADVGHVQAADGGAVGRRAGVDVDDGERVGAPVAVGARVERDDVGQLLRGSLGGARGGRVEGRIGLERHEGLRSREVGRAACLPERRPGFPGIGSGAARRGPRRERAPASGQQTAVVRDPVRPPRRGCVRDAAIVDARTLTEPAEARRPPRTPSARRAPCASRSAAEPRGRPSVRPFSTRGGRGRRSPSWALPWALPRPCACGRAAGRR